MIDRPPTVRLSVEESLARAKARFPRTMEYLA